MLRRLFQKSLFYFATLVFGKLLTAVFFIVIARILQPEKFGEITFFMTLTQVISVIADLGLKSWYQKHTALRRDPNLLSQLTLWRLLLYLFTVGVLSIFQLVTHFFTASLFPLILVALAWESLLTIADAYYLSRCQSLRLGIKLIARNLLLFISLLVIHTPDDAPLFYWAYDLTLGLVAAFYFPWRQLDWHWYERFWQQRHWCSIHDTWTYAVIDDLGILYSRADQLIIEHLVGSVALGIYSAAYRFVDAFNLLPQALFHNLFPLAARKGGLARSQIVKMVIVMTLLGLGVATGIYFCADLLTVTLLGPAYAPAAQVLRAFGPVIVLFFFNAPLNTVLQSSDRVRSYIPFLLFSAAVNIILNFLFLPTFGILGSAYAMLVGESLLVAINIFLTCNFTKKK